MKRIFSFLLVIFFLMPCFCFAQEQDDEITLLEAGSAEDVAAALMDLEGDPEARLVVYGDELPQDIGKCEVIYYDDYDEYILQYSSAEEASSAQELLEADYDVYQDQILTIENLSENLLGNPATYTYGTTLMGVDYYIDGVPSSVDSVTVGVVDSGVDPNNPWFSDGIIRSDSVDLATPDAGALTDASGHGTHVCGIVADMTPSQVKILSVDIFDGKTSTLTLVMTGVQYCIEHNVDVINLSLGMEADAEDNPLEPILERAKAQGIVVACASGNDHARGARYPANSQYTVCVNGIDIDKNYYHFGNYGDEVDFCAPADDVYSADIATGQKKHETKKTGTSMASPHIAAAFAYLKLAYPSYSVDELYDELKGYCIDLGDTGWDERYGWGLPNLDGLFEINIPMKNCYIKHWHPTVVYTGKSLKPEVDVHWKSYNGILLKEGTHYTVTYKNNKAIGTGIIVITGNGKFYGSVKKTFKIVPAQVKWNSLSSSGKNAITLKWKSVKGATRYQIAYKKKGAKSWTKVSLTKTTKTFKKLSHNKKYYFKIRAYKKVDGKNYIGDWSDTWSVVVG